MKRAILAVSMCLGVSPAFATNWALNSTLSQSVQLNDNPFLRAVAAGAFVTLLDRRSQRDRAHATSKFTFNGNVAYQKFMGTRR